MKIHVVIEEREFENKNSDIELDYKIIGGFKQYTNAEILSNKMNALVKEKNINYVVRTIDILDNNGEDQCKYFYQQTT